jgi:predicted enzyme related to lactoylglutathione lyase
MSNPPPFQGLRTVLYHVPDLAQAKAWYSTALETQPYFDQPFYVGFNVAGYELGLVPGTAGKPEKETGVVAYWGVADASAALSRLLKLGARPHDVVQDVGEGIRLATVTDPFGNIFGIIENPNFKLPGK